MKINASPLRCFLCIQHPLVLEICHIKNVENTISKPSTFQNLQGEDAPRAPSPSPPPKKNKATQLKLRSAVPEYITVQWIT